MNTTDYFPDGSDPNVELAYAGLNTFLKSDPVDVTELDDVDVAVLGAPYDNGATNRPGARYGPRAIRRASNWWGYLSEYEQEMTDTRTGNSVDFSELSIVDCGDVPVFPMDHERTSESIAAHVRTVAERAFPILLGGDHSCSYPATRGFAAGVDADRIGVVQIDAHSDTVPDDQVFGTHFHGSSMHHIATSSFCDYEHLSQVGVRGFESPQFFDFVDESGVNLYTMDDVHERGVRPVLTDAIERAAADTDAVYVTFDVDAIDPSVAPGTGTPCPGGLTARQALAAMDTIGDHECVGAIDFMEVAPTYDPTGRTPQAAAFLLLTLIGNLIPDRRP